MTSLRGERRTLRMDWRHLLPSADGAVRRSAVVLGLPDGDADALVDSGVVEQVVDYSAEAPLRPVELVVAGASVSSVELHRAALSLSAGGVLYVERNRTSKADRNLRGARQAARRAGLNEVGRWAVLPDFSDPRRLLPLDHRGALLWYFRYNFRAGDAAARIGRIALMAGAGAPQVMEKLVPSTILVAVRGPLLPVRPIPGESGRAGCRRAIITSGHDLGSRSIVLPFEPRSSWPAVVIKVATRPQLGDATREEHERVKELRRRLPGPIASALPVPLSSFELAGLAAAAESPARGPTMWARSGTWRQRSGQAGTDLDVMNSWLIGLAQATARPGPEDPAGAWLEQPLADLKSMGIVDAVLDELIKAAAQEVRSAGCPLSCVLQHYDAGPWNVVRVGDGLCVLDWELDRQAGRDGFGPPMVDLLYFVGSWHSLAQGITSGEGQTRDLVRLFGASPRDRWQTALARRAVERYAEEVKIPRSLTRAMLVALWLERAVTSRRRWHRIEAGAPWDDTPVRYLKALARET